MIHRPGIQHSLPTMGLKVILSRTSLAQYVAKIKAAPREVILSRKLLLSAFMYATAAIPLSK